MNGNILDTCWFCRQAVPADTAENFGKTEVSPGEFRRNYVHSACLAAAEKAEQANKA